METIQVEHFDDWRRKARQLLQDEVPGHSIQFVDDDGQGSLFQASMFQASLFVDNEAADDRPRNDHAVHAEPSSAAQSSQIRVSPAFLKMAEAVACHRDSQRWNLLYRVLWRLTHGEPQLLNITTDDDVLLLTRMEKQVSRDAHKMKAFVRFRKVDRDGEEYFIAWHKPDHRIVRRVAPFFSRRFKAMNWTILTPDESVVWDQRALTYGAGVERSEAPDSDQLEELWKTYYASIFNPARIKIKMMKSEMPVRHWPTLPESELIPDLIASAPERVKQMIDRHEGFSKTANQYLDQPEAKPQTLSDLQQLAIGCKACELYQGATQIVFGQGSPQARLVLVGEQPGDQEDLQGTPFVGPAGQILNQVLNEVGIQRDQVYLTNVVKHFKFKETSSPRGKRRLHQKPAAREIRCCRPWLETELEMIRPDVVVCLGATAAKALINPGFHLVRQRGQFIETPFCSNTLATYHPSAALRNPDQDRSGEIVSDMIRDLQLAWQICQTMEGDGPCQS